MARWRVGGAAVAALLLATSCSHQISQSPGVAGQQLSFGKDAVPTGPSPTAHLLSHQLPTGAAIMVHLRRPLSSATARAGDPFLAVLQEPVQVQGGRTLAAGSELTGRVLEVASAESLKAAGYLRLTLVELKLSGKTVPLKTSSIFLKAAGIVPSDMEVSPRRILALRIAEPVDLSD